MEHPVRPDRLTQPDQDVDEPPIGSASPVAPAWMNWTEGPDPQDGNGAQGSTGQQDSTALAEAVEEHYLRGRPHTPSGPGHRRGQRAAEDDSTEGGRKISFVAKIVGLSTASILLCAAIAAAAVASHQRSEPASSTQTAAGEITGVRALDPRGAAGYGPPPSATVGPVERTGGTDTESPDGSQSRENQANGTGGEVSIASARSAEEMFSFVATFYQLLDTAPRDALELIDPALLGDRGDRLVRSWQTMRDIRITGIELRDSSTVVVAVSMRNVAGDQIRLRQSLRLSGPHYPRIEGARVLSVQRS
ncbi:hypothetical protein EV191_109224 [Tamaricihabitans halophyticus]|uniref:Uncharacterized protein n=1 Tax=Tamaricihabitans halophyticus TaxID=1262583 RepID=A0A4R2QJ58_9PSEU|nr:hypothetical protein [Tamaricihabitans halophyticus]TCP49402.1 hypothetical protein EV191_109224 [Tamaricihabitans halophyticus]